MDEGEELTDYSPKSILVLCLFADFQDGERSSLEETTSTTASTTISSSPSTYNNVDDDQCQYMDWLLLVPNYHHDPEEEMGF